MQEASGVGIHFQQAMNGFGRVTGRFSQSLGGSACGRCQRKGNFLGMQNFENGANDGGLSDARSTRQNHETLQQGIANRFDLRICQLDFGLPLNPLYRPFQINGRIGCRLSSQSKGSPGNTLFGFLESRKKDKRLFPQYFPNHRPFAQRLLQA